MMNLGFSRVALSIGAAALFAGCGGSQLPIATPNLLQKYSPIRELVQTRSLGPAYKASGPLLFVASDDETLTPLRIYKAKASDPKPFATISKDIDSSSGACIDGDGTLYVANEASPGWVSEYALGQTKPLRVITKGINTPAYCAIDASGNLWVTNIGLDDVAEYLKGSTKPHATITKGLTYPDGIAIDHAGNLYVGNLQPHSAPNIQVYAPGSKSPSRTITDGVTWPVGIAVDAHDTLYVTNSTAPGNVEEYRFGQRTPYRAITDELVYPEDVVVGKNGWLYVANSGYSSDQQAILEFPPGSMKPSSREITKGFFNPQGLAYYPPVLP
jgi:serine/threonine protein kinase, bacterial